MQKREVFKKLKELDALQEYHLEKKPEIKDSPLSKNMEDLQEELSAGLADLADQKLSFTTFDKVVVEECERGGCTAYVGLTFNQDLPTVPSRQ